MAMQSMQVVKHELSLGEVQTLADSSLPQNANWYYWNLFGNLFMGGSLRFN
jgi:hypothetical protein